MPAKKTTTPVAPEPPAPKPPKVLPKQATRPSLARLLASEVWQEDLKAIVASPAFNCAHALITAGAAVSDHDILAMPAEVIARKAAAHAMLSRFPDYLLALIQPKTQHKEVGAWEHINPTIQ